MLFSAFMKKIIAFLHELLHIRKNLIMIAHKGGRYMKIGKKLLNMAVKTTAEKALKRDANTTTCAAFYQPKVPANYNQFKNNKK